MNRHGLKTQKLVAIFLVGVLLLNYPLLSLFRDLPAWGGVPSFYVYLFVVWAVIIGLMALAVEGWNK